MTEPQTWADALTGPFGGLVAVCAIGWAVLAGKLRLEREVSAMVAETTKERERADKWEKLAMQLLRANSQALQVASASVSTSQEPPL